MADVPDIPCPTYWNTTLSYPEEVIKALMLTSTLFWAFPKMPFSCTISTTLSSASLRASSISSSLPPELEQSPIPVVETRSILVQARSKYSSIREINENRLSHDPHVVRF